ncbi:hypothetical protein N431DRAFT_445352 [Stipitochalara longipes BDJ]|nr:hypothetical protein N431DRAFT_445352 [Stipitochalara longipes BDJ]
MSKPSTNQIKNHHMAIEPLNQITDSGGQMSMDNKFSADGDLSDAHKGAVKAQGEDSIDELATLLSPFDSSTTLIPASPTENNPDPEAQQPSTVVSDENSPPMTWRDTGYVVFTIFTVFTSFVVPNALEISGYDPLYFTKLAWSSIVVCLVVSMIFVSITESDRVKQRRNDKSISTPSHIRFALFNLALIYWGTWLAFYGMIWLWAVLRYPGSQQSLLQMSRIWREFQTKMETKDALTKLTSCLREAIPDRNATIADITTCLKEMGIHDE